MTPILAKQFGRPGKAARRNQPSGPYQMTVERLEAREVPIVGAFAIPAPVPAGAGLDGVVHLFTSGGPSGTGTLLADGRHILTAAHVVTEDDGHVDPAASTRVVFNLPGGDVSMKVPAANYHIHPGWEGSSRVFIPDDDLAILELSSLAPAGAERRNIYRGRDEVGQTFKLVGYGKTGTGDTGATIDDGLKRQGLNGFSVAEDGKLEFVFGKFANEVFVAPGDSGGPDLLSGKIAGVNAAVRGGFGGPEFVFGERAFSTRVSSYTGWIDEQTAGGPLVLDMSFQPDGDDGHRDTINVRVIDHNLQIRVNGRLYQSEPAASVDSLTILGSNDSEDFVIEGPLPVDVSISGRGSSELLPQSLTVLGTIGPDAVTVGPGTVTFGAHTISHTLDLTVNTLGGNDVITVAGAIPVPVRLLGGADSDTLIGPDGDNQWFLRGTNGGILNSAVTFADVENLQGGAAPDAFLFGLGSVTGTINGGAGGGTLDYTSFFGPITVNLQSGTALFIAGGFSNITGVIGTRSSVDVLIGRNQPSVWNVTAPNAGQIAGSLAQSAVSFAGFENLQGGAAADTFRFSNAGRVSGTVDGGGGIALFGLPFPVDMLDYSLRSTRVVVDLTRGLTPSVGKALRIEGVTGTPNDDLLRGDARDNVLVGGGGSDVLVGEDGNDKLVAGNTGRCVLIGGRGQDTLVGGNPSPSDPLTGRPASDGSDLLIGGRTTFDDDDQALAAILSQWGRRDRTYDQRVQDLRTGVPLSTGVVVQLTTATVLDDRAADRMAGRGGADWFWGLAVEATDRSGGISQAGVPEFLN